MISFANCIQACNDCQRACNECNQALIKSPRLKELLRCFTLNRDCALFCQSASLLLEHGSEFLPQVCQLCLEACEAAASENALFNLPHCDRAAKACRHFAHECSSVLLALDKKPIGQ